MADFPAMPWYADAYMADTPHLTLEQHGAYRSLLDIAWRHCTCTITTDDKMLARSLGITLGKWRKMKGVILPFWDLVEIEVDGSLCSRFQQKKQQKIREKVSKNVQQRIDAGKRSAEARALNNNNSPPTDVPTDDEISLQSRANESGDLVPTTISITKDILPTTTTTAPRHPEFLEVADEITKLAKLEDLAMPMDLVQVWLRRYSRQTILEGVRECVGNGYDANSIITLKYFEKAIMRVNQKHAGILQRKIDATVAGMDDERWEKVLQMHIERGIWPEEYGPLPGYEDTYVPVALERKYKNQLVEAKNAKIIPFDKNPKDTGG